VDYQAIENLKACLHLHLSSVPTEK
jgi:hypothetical protein